jgi:hypothetical protein
MHRVPGTDGMEEQPVTPHAGPRIDAEGRITYVGDDGRRYVVGLPPDADEASVERVMALLGSGGDLFHRIETLCRQWIARVSGDDIDERAALMLLLTTLETALEQSYPEGGGDG